MTPDLLGGDITNPQSLNRYAYALNNPTTLTDPSGLDPFNGIDCRSYQYADANAECQQPGSPWCFTQTLYGGPCSSLPSPFPGGGGGGGGGTEAGGSAPTVAVNPPAASPTGPFNGPSFISTSDAVYGPIIFNPEWILRVTSWGWPWIVGAAADAAEVGSRVAPLAGIAANVLLMKGDTSPAGARLNASRLPYTSPEEVRRNCTPVGAPVVRPSTSRPGWTSEEQEFNCQGLTCTVHCLVSPTRASSQCHVRPGPPKGE